MQRRPRHLITDRDLDHALTRQHRPDRVQPQLNDRQDNQRHSRPPIRNNVPTKNANGSESPKPARLSHIN